MLWNTNLIKQYQKERLTAFLNQNDDTLGNGYQLNQSKIAIGSGGVYGKGSKDKFGSLICVGVCSGLLISVIINMGMTIGMMPITGITLPFVSYGGSSLLTNSVAVGMALNVGMRSKGFKFN